MKVVLVAMSDVTFSVNDASTNELSTISTSSRRKNMTSLMVMLCDDGPASILNLNIYASMELSNWKFRRALEGMASYPESKPFRVEIERGSKYMPCELGRCYPW